MTSTVTRPQPRSDLLAMEGYHSPQVDVQVRLNTNESPVAPPVAWQETLADEVAGIDFHRYPDRAAMALRQGIADLHGVEPANVLPLDQVPEAYREQVVEIIRDATLHRKSPTDTRRATIRSPSTIFRHWFAPTWT